MTKIECSYYFVKKSIDKILILSIIPILLFSSLNAKVYGNIRYGDSDVISVTVKDILANRASYDGKIIKVNGTLVAIAGRAIEYQLVEEGYAVDLAFNSTWHPKAYLGLKVTAIGLFAAVNESTLLNVSELIVGSGQIVQESFHSTGNPNVLVIPVIFSDKENMMTTYEVASVVNSMGDYYLENSLGKLNFSVWYVSMWMMMPHSYSYYGSDTHFNQYISNALALVDSYVNFNGFQFVIVVHAGDDEAYSHYAGDIWSMSYVGGVPFLTNDGIVTIGTCTVAEFDPMGVYAHESGHMLGLPDLYDYDGIETFVGEWDLMDAGSWNGPVGLPGSSPAHCTSYGKIQLGWLNASNVRQVNMGENVTVLLSPLEVPSASFQAIRIPLSSSVYYLVEVRKKVGYDTYLPGQGVLVLFVNETLESGHGIVCVMNPSLQAYGVGAVYEDVKRNIEIRVVSSSGPNYYVQVAMLQTTLRDFETLFAGNNVTMIYPSDQTPKPLGCGPALVSDWTASAFIYTKLNDVTERLDTNGTFVNQTSGRVLGSPGVGIISFGGSFVNPTVKYAELDTTPAQDRAPLKFHDDWVGHIYSFQHSNGTSIPGASMSSLTIGQGQDMFMIEVFMDKSGRYVMFCYGFGWKGTYAAGKYFHTTIYPNLNSYDVSWIIVKWNDTNLDGFVNAPNDGDTYTIIASGT